MSPSKSPKAVLYYLLWLGVTLTISGICGYIRREQPFGFVDIIQCLFVSGITVSVTPFALAFGLFLFTTNIVFFIIFLVTITAFLLSAPFYELGVGIPLMLCGSIVLLNASEDRKYR